MNAPPPDNPRAGLGTRLKSIWITLRAAYGEFQRDNGELMAAAVSFYTLLALVPMLLVAISVVGHILGSSPRAAQQVLGFVHQHFLPSAKESAYSFIDALVQNRNLIGGVGLLTLAWSASQGLVTLETAVNVAWDRPARNFLVARLFALTMFVVVGVLFLLSMATTAAQDALGRMPGMGWLAHSWSVRLGALMLAIAVSTVMFAFIYRFFPNGGAQWRPAWEAGFITAVVWEIAKHAYAWYAGKVADYSSVYGPLGSLIGLVVWIYYSSFLMVLGSEIAWIRQKHPDLPQVADTQEPPTVARA